MTGTVQPLRWPAEAVWEAVAPLLPGFTVEVLPSIDSTNTELMRRARAGRCEPTLLVAEVQTAGRGRLGRAWQNAAGDSLMFSLGLPLAPADWSGLSLAVGVSIAESLQPVPRAGQPRLGLKWPNDLWLDDGRKLGGILVETASLVGAAGAWSSSHPDRTARYVVAGVGINVRPPPSEGLSTPPGSLQEIDARLDAPAALLRTVPPLVAMLQSFEAHGFAPVQPRFLQRDVLRDREVVLSDGGAGTAQGVANDGALLVRTAQGLQAVTSAEISVRPAGQALPRN
ncbi:biotin--[acetyl-CoA-carboxylase] ligase [Paracidovorax oryzae]|uniref:biotin--[acetyl-CoA-carboxylase] ligase n=1 Tax=Paracidovorax oryzae TaxID=862720 RepID=UPI0002F0072C|nr:biotin--[acetyl-CoA-carboxylase] ligase [Paracidovorax oryzae]